MPGPNGTIAHAEVKIDDSIVILADAGERFQPAEKKRAAGSLGSLDRYVRLLPYFWWHFE